MSILLAMRAGHLAERLVDGGKWTLVANTNRHLVRRDTDAARRRACPGDGTLIIRPCDPLSGEKRGMCIFWASGSRIRDRQRCCCSRYQFLARSPARLGGEPTTCVVDKRHAVGHLPRASLIKHMLH